MKRPSGYKRGFFKNISMHILLCILYIIPLRMTYIFIEVALTSLVARYSRHESDIDMVKFFEVVNVSRYKREVVSLPSYSIHALWSEDFLNQKAPFSPTGKTVAEVIASRDSLQRHLEAAIDIVLINLPPILVRKLGIHSEPTRLKVRGNFVNYVRKQFDIGNGSSTTGISSNA